MLKKLFLSILMLTLAFTITAADAKENIQPKANVNQHKSQCKDITVTEKIPGVYVVKINTAILKGELKPHFVVHLTTNNDVYNETKARLVVNAGFFDPKNEQTISYLTLNGNMFLDPHRNSNLMNNEVLKPYMDKILNRSEFRIYESNGKLKYDITPHNTPVPEGLKLKHAVQGGPALLPDTRLEEEFFVLKKDGKIISQSASSLLKYARTIIGIKENNVYIVIVTTKTPMTLPEVAEFGKTLGLEKMMAFDGGGSTSFDYENYHIVSEKDETARKLKSFLIITNQN